ncbi:putative EsaC protein -like (Listeria type 3) [Lactococcus cremoris]|uniref:Putative EsaC protein-like (Listeria type 3) n=1 Tax=Lactococcus lactis subsp. cremoris TaxID=1359 RepID=A0A166J2S6_LACLC|nr:DUF4176 domain-containing protein [Lactococcus cremoris]KZK05427.1 putative EsaC protein -like (Listeria type 3) [Lactococcus cremoris]
MKNNILPLGTVVTLKNGDSSELMIIARASVVEQKGEQVYYDYGAVLIPQGMMQPEAVYFFNEENVEKIVFEGYENNDEKIFSQNYHEMVAQSKVPKGNISSSDSVDTEEAGFE